MTTSRLEERIGYLLKRAQQALGDAMAEALADHGVTNAQYAALSALGENPGLSNAELARRSFVTPQTMNQIVAHLERAGLVSRKPDPRHGRILETRLTVRGEAVVGDCHRKVLAIERRMLARLRPAERTQLAASLRRCVDALDE